MKKHLLITILLLSFGIQAFAQQANTLSDGTLQHKYSASIPYLNLTNFNPLQAIHQEMHIGYRVNPKNTVGIRLVTWSLVAPLGIPWGPYLANQSENYPGRLREYGIGMFYERYLWKNLFTAVEVVPLKKKYVDPQGEKIGKGFRLYTSLHAGYYIPMFKNRMFIKPQFHFNYWAVNTDAPDSFRPQDEKWSNNYFFPEPNVYIGVNF